jgi:hypothetical protein
MKKIVLIMVVAVLANVSMDKPLCANARKVSYKVDIAAIEKTSTLKTEEIAIEDSPMQRLATLY